MSKCSFCLSILFLFSCVGGTDNIKHQNELDLFETIDPSVSNKYSSQLQNLHLCLDTQTDALSEDYKEDH